MSTPTGLAFYGQFAEVAPLLVLLEQVRVAGLDLGCDVAWGLPPDVLPGVTAAYGYPVVRTDTPALLLIPKETGR